MPGHEVTDNGSELTDLESKATVFPRRHPRGIFIQANGSTMVARIEPTIESRLCIEVNLRSKLGVEKQCQTRVEEIVDRAVDESRRRWLEIPETVPSRRNRSKMCGCASGGIGRPVLPMISKT